jgi:hypothetical protein
MTFKLPEFENPISTSMLSYEVGTITRCCRFSSSPTETCRRLWRCYLGRFTSPILLNQQYDAAILPQDDGIGTDVSAIATQTLSCSQIKRAIVKRTNDGRPADQAVRERSPSMRAIRLSRGTPHRSGQSIPFELFTPSSETVQVDLGVATLIAWHRDAVCLPTNTQFSAKCVKQSSG